MSGKKSRAKKPSKEILELSYAEKLKNVFRIMSLDQLVKHDVFTAINTHDADTMDVIQHDPLKMDIKYN